jgi:glutathione S-transferase
MSNAKYTLYYYPNNASLAPHMVLEYLAVDYELILVDRETNSHKNSEYLALNPAGRIPTLLVDGKACVESPAICLYLAEAHSESGLAPAVHSDIRAEFLQWLMYLTNTFQSELMVYIYPDRHGCIGMAAEQLIDAQQVRLNGVLEILDQQLVGKQHLLGEQLTVCDYFLCMLCLGVRDFPKPPMEFAKLSAYLRNLAVSDVVQSVCKKEDISLEAYL